MSLKIIVLDTETTGLDKKSLTSLTTPTSITNRGSEVCQIGGMLLTETMRPYKCFCYYCDTVAAESTPDAFMVHGLRQRDIRRTLSGVYLEEILQTYLPEVFEDNVIFIGYNIEFDMTMIAQTIANSRIPFFWRTFRGIAMPKSGRQAIDIAEYVKCRQYYRKLSSFDKELEESRKDFIGRLQFSVGIDTNHSELLEEQMSHAHNSFFDSVSTYLLWMDRVWKKKLL